MTELRIGSQLDFWYAKPWNFGLDLNWASGADKGLRSYIWSIRPLPSILTERLDKNSNQLNMPAYDPPPRSIRVARDNINMATRTQHNTAFTEPSPQEPVISPGAKGRGTREMPLDVDSDDDLVVVSMRTNREKQLDAELQREKKKTKKVQDALSEVENAFKALRDAEYQRLTCPICLDLMKKPHLLSCGHVFCYRCICRHAQHAHDKERNAECPTCRDIIGYFTPLPCYILNESVAQIASMAEHEVVTKDDQPLAWPEAFELPPLPLPFPPSL
ncbi:hypothetical protein DFJ43DRAFT_1150551 [Lentinula guzmanii]|uniref:RING-type domain-containing protein n=2 Tax=Lentinula TaxID=5352 RepID=A0AA38JTZ5_9AGAR|nr:hypothetical protein DFJ43DRAFT_1150551 [Lentinula guzmanii]KAJ3746810.1 hypothetical protein DFH05DRAFT_1523450 [Lentinula detonsa]